MISGINFGSLIPLCGRDGPCGHDEGPGHHDKVTLGGRSETSKVYRPQPGSVARPEVTAVLDKVKFCDVEGIVHTTRSIPREEYHVPAEPSTFAAGRFHVLLSEPKSGERIGFVFETEAGVGHLQPVTPGATEISGGYISLLADPEAPNGKMTTLNRPEQDRLMTQLYQRHTTKMTVKQAESFQSVVNYTSAVRYSGEGREAAVGKHNQLAAQVVARQGAQLAAE
jgi:hypothetical protein